jgi:transposase
MDCLGWMIQVVLRLQQTQGFVLLKKRSVAEQTFGWLNWYRRLSKGDRLTILTSLFKSLSLASSAFKKLKIIFVHISRV